MSLRDSLSFGFEQTFTIPEWWTEPGFVATSDTPLKREKMELLARHVARELRGRYVQSVDIYGHIQFETFDAEGTASFVVTMDPGCIEVKTQPRLVREIRREMEPLFAAAAAAGVVPYRQWWYGVRSGTEGGCHVNMGGFSRETNPLYRDPALVLKYAAFFHNNPWIHYPFMGVDVGPGGNAMRMDEHNADSKGGENSAVEKFAAVSALVSSPAFGAAAVSEWFAGTPLVEDKHSAPSFYKFKEPLFLLEDRAVEAMRSAEECELVAELRVRIFEHLESQPEIETLRDFGPALHQEQLSSDWLWKGFEAMAARLGFAAGPYRVFFDRQFPKLEAGSSIPSRFTVREGRRPRVITAVKKRGELVISKTIDTNHGRLELHCEAPLGGVDSSPVFVLNGIECEPVAMDAGRGLQLVVDYHRPAQDSVLDIRLRDRSKGAELDSGVFHLNNMMFAERASAPEPKATSALASRPGYARLELG